MAKDCYVETDDAYDQTDECDELDGIEIPNVPWKDDIEHIENPEIKLEEIQEAEKFYAKKQELGGKVERGEISLGAYQSILKPIAMKASTRCAFKSVGISGDDWGSLAEDVEFLSTGDPKMIELKDRVKKKIEDIGPDAAQERADKRKDDGTLSDDTHNRISRQIRIQRRGTGR